MLWQSSTTKTTEPVEWAPSTYSFIVRWRRLWKMKIWMVREPECDIVYHCQTITIEFGIFRTDKEMINANWWNEWGNNGNFKRVEVLENTLASNERAVKRIRAKFHTWWQALWPIIICGCIICYGFHYLCAMHAMHKFEMVEMALHFSLLTLPLTLSSSGLPYHIYPTFPFLLLFHRLEHRTGSLCNFHSIHWIEIQHTLPNTHPHKTTTVCIYCIYIVKERRSQ